MVMTARVSDRRGQGAVEVSNDDGQGTAEGAHGPTLTESEVTQLNGLEHLSGSVDRGRLDMCEMLSDDETLTALEHYAPLFEQMGVSVGPALKTLKTVRSLRRLERRLEAALWLVHRHLVAKVGPIASLSSDVHRLVIATPEGSPVRAAFAVFEERWQKVFAKGGRPAKETSTPSGNEPNAPR